MCDTLHTTATLDVALATAVHWNESVNRAAILEQGSPSTSMHQRQCRHRSNGNKITINHHECDFLGVFLLFVSFQRSDVYLSLIPEKNVNKYIF